MAAKKKKKKTTTQKRQSRLDRAKNWLPTYEGTKIVQAYRNKFAVDTVCAIRELEGLGHIFEPGYVENLLKSETSRVEHLRKQKEEKRQLEEYNDWQDDRFCFIAGYTSGGAAYGTTWEEMGLEPYGNEFDEDEEIICHRHYDFLNKHEKDYIDNKLRQDFTQFVSKNRRLPSKVKQKSLIESVFSNCPNGPIIYSKDFNSTYRKLVRKRENQFIREGVLPKRFTPTEINKFFEQSIMLESERLVFKKLTESDFDNLALLFRDAEVMAAWEHTFTDEEISKWINNQIERYKKEIVGYFAVINKETGEFIGQMGLMWSDFEELRVLEIGYMLKRDCWGMGYATEGAKSLAEFAFNVIGLNKVYASIRPENITSILVANRIGMEVTGSFIKQYKGRNMEHIIYTLERNHISKT